MGIGAELVWHLEPQEYDVGSGSTWQLVINLPGKAFQGASSLPSLVELSSSEVRIAVPGGSDESEERVLTLPVPAHAQPLVAETAVCTFSRKRCQLRVKWPQQCAPACASDAGSVETGATVLSPAQQVVSESERNDRVEDLGQHVQVREMDIGDKATATAGTSKDAANTTDNAAGTAEDATVAAERERARCHQCGEQAKLCCARCKAAWYCSARCQRAHWAADHRTRCALAARLLGVEQQRHRGDAELALMNAEELLKEVGRAMKAEVEKEYTYEAVTAAALLRFHATCTAALAHALASATMPGDKFCRGAFRAMATLLDIAALLGNGRRPQVLQLHIEGIVAGLEGSLREDADPVLSAWMFYDGYVRGLEDRPSSYSGNVGKLRSAALIALRDALAVGHDLLEQGGDADRRASVRIDRLLDRKELSLGGEDLRQLHPFFPEVRRADPDSSDEG